MTSPANATCWAITRRSHDVATSAVTYAGTLDSSVHTVHSTWLMSFARSSDIGKKMPHVTHVVKATADWTPRLPGRRAAISGFRVRQGVNVGA